MKKDKFPEDVVINENITTGEEGPEAITPTNPVADALIAIRELPQADRLTLYKHLDNIINYDRDRASQGVDGATHLFDEAINKL